MYVRCGYIEVFLLYVCGSCCLFFVDFCLFFVVRGVEELGMLLDDNVVNWDESGFLVWFVF